MRMRLWLPAAVVLIVPFALAQFRADSRLVEVYAAVYDHKGNYVEGIDKERFQVTDADQPQSILSFESTSEDVNTAILLDTTGSMQEALGATRNAVSALLDQMREGDSVGVFGFNASVTTLQEFTTDKAAAKRAVLRIRASGRTALFDAIAEVSQEIAARDGKKAMVLFTDGADNASAIHPDAAVRRALKTGVPIYAIAEGEATTSDALLKQLESLSTQTGGAVYRARSPKDIARVFIDIQNALKHLYLISYKPPHADETKWRPIRVAVAGMPDVTIRARQGYFPN